MIRYHSRLGDGGALREKLRDLALRRRRFGYRRLHILLRREGLIPPGQADPERIRRELQ